jgi:hypothetical protein
VLDPDHVIALEIPSPPSSIVVGDTVRLTARALNAMGTPVPDVTIRWAVVDTGVTGFTLDESGLVTATAPDTGRVQARVDDLRSDPIQLKVVASLPGPAACCGAAVEASR